MEIPDKCEFLVGADQIRLKTQANGDHINIVGIHLGAEDAASLAFLINIPDTQLKIEIKEA